MTYQHTRIYNIFLGKLRQEVGFESETLLYNLDIERNIIFKIDKRYMKIKTFFMCGLLLKNQESKHGHDQSKVSWCLSFGYSVLVLAGLVNFVFISFGVTVYRLHMTVTNDGYTLLAVTLSRYI
jgi:hypothetical protein